MRIRPEWCYGTLILKTDEGGYAFSADFWPGRLRIADMLLVLCGRPDSEGYYVFHEDHQWLEQHLRGVSRLSEREVGMLAIRDAASLVPSDQENVSLAAAGTLAVAIFQKAFGAKREDAAMMVRMNVIGSAKLAEK